MNQAFGLLTVFAGSIFARTPRTPYIQSAPSRRSRPSSVARRKPDKKKVRKLMAKHSRRINRRYAA